MSTLIDDFTRGGGESSPYPLTGHTGSNGSTWTGSSNMQINPDGYANGSSSGAIYLVTSSTLAPSDDYELGATTHWVSTENFTRTNVLIRATSSAGTDGYFGVIGSSAGTATVFIQNNDGVFASPASHSFTPVVGRDYYVITSASGTTIAVAVKDTVAGLWMDTSGAFTSATRTNAISTTVGTSTGRYFGVQSYLDGGITPATQGVWLDDLSLGTVGELPASIPSSQTIAVTDTHIYFSPYNWYSDGAGSMQATNVNGSSTYAETVSCGAYLKFSVSGAATGSIKLNVDSSTLSPETPTIGWSIDGKAMSTETISSYNSSLQVTLGTDLGSGTHTFVIWWTERASNSDTDRWSAPLYKIKVTGLEIPGSASMQSLSLGTKTMIVYGDSITEGAGMNPVDGTQVYGALVARALDAEVGILGFSAEGWSQVGFGGVPAFSSAWDLYGSGKSRLVGGALTPAPDYMIINHGRNGSFTSGTVTSTLASISAAAPSATIFVVPTFGQTNASTILAATLPTNGHFVDLGVLPEFDDAHTTGLWFAGDGVHPNLRGQTALASILSQRFQAIIGGTSTATAVAY